VSSHVFQSLYAGIQSGWFHLLCTEPHPERYQMCHSLQTQLHEVQWDLQENKVVEVLA